MLNSLLVYVPLSIIGLWRWSYWLVRIIGAALYRPPATPWPANKKQLSLSIVTPVYNESEPLFDQAMDSWIANGVDEIIAVIDKSNAPLIVEFEKKYTNRSDVRCQLVVTPKIGKRSALCDGVNRAQGDLIAFVDSDTVWGEDVRKKALPYFLDQKVGGVTVAQRIMNPHSLSNVLFDILLWTRYHEEVPFLLGLGKAFNTLSGRTAIYRREALINDTHDNLHQLRHEFFFGTRGISGDDKRLSHLILEQGWHVGYVKDAVVYTEGLDKMRVFLRQRLRWIRNSWRADLRAIKRGWIWRHPVLAYFIIDRFIQPFFMLLGPTACAIAIIQRRWLIVEVLVAWWLISRTVRLSSYFRHYPKRIIYLPFYIIYSYINALIKIYALGTLLEHSWATRWHKSRLRKGLLRRSLVMATGTTAVAAVLFMAGHLINQINKEAAATIPRPTPVAQNEFNLLVATAQNAPPAPVLPAKVILPTAVKTYVTKPGDSFTELASRFGMSVKSLKKLNGISNTQNVNAGSTILYYDLPAK